MKHIVFSVTRVAVFTVAAAAVVPVSRVDAGPKSVSIAVPVIVKSLASSPTHAAAINCLLWAEAADLHQLAVGTLQTTLALGTQTATVVIALNQPEFAAAYKAYYGPSHYSCYANLTPSNDRYEPTLIKGALAADQLGLSFITNTGPMTIAVKPNPASGMHVNQPVPGKIVPVAASPTP